MLELIYGTVGVISLILFVWDAAKIEPKIIQIYYCVMDTGEFQINAMVTNVGRRTAKNCSAKIYLENNPIQNLSFSPIDSPIGRIGLDWPAYTSFKIHPNTPIWLRGYLNPNYEGKKVHVRLFLNGREVDQFEHFTLTK
jgi:hypothetical protein